MAASAWLVHHNFKELLGNGVIDLETDVLKMALFTSASNVFDATIAAYGSATNEHANGNGYTTGGVTLTTVVWSETTGVLTFTCDNASWSASGGDLIAKYAAIYDDTVAAPTAKPIICSCNLDTGGSSITAGDGNTLAVQIHANGVFTLANA